SVFISLDFFLQLRDTPGDRFDAAFAELALENKHAVLRPRDIAKANARDGLVLCAPFSLKLETRRSEKSYIIRQSLAQPFDTLHLGYNLQAITVPVRHADDLAFMMKAGARILNASDFSGPSEGIGRLPYTLLVGMSREEAVRGVGGLLTRYFAYTPPVF